MAKKKKRSFGEKLAAAQQSSFVGRKAQLDKFRENINLGAEHDNFLNIFNIHGQGGVGKSTLLQEYLRIAKESGYALASVDTETRRLYEVTATMSSLAEQLDQEGGDFSKFNKTYKTYLQEKGKLEADPERPSGTLGTLVSSGLNMGAKVAREAVPGSGLFATDDLIKSTAKIGGELADFAYRKLTNKDEVKLVLEPLEVLTPLWITAFNDLLDKKNILLTFDTYEVANKELDQWLVRLLKGEFGELEDANFVLVIAGRHQLESSNWSYFTGITQPFLLDKFSEEEATSYLQKRGVTNQVFINEILAISNCLPVYLALLADTGSNEDIGSIQDPNDKVVARFLKHINDPVLKLLATRAALPRHLNQDIIATLFADQPTLDHTPQVLFEWLISRPFIQRRGDHWTYHPIVRESIQRYLRERSLVEWEGLHEKLASFYHDRLAKFGLEEEDDQFANENWRLERTEEVYHLLCQSYKQHIKLAVEYIVSTWRLVGHHAANLVVEVMLEREKNGKNVESWGILFRQGIGAFESENYQDALSFFNKINKVGFLNQHKKNAVLIFSMQGYCYSLQGNYDQAISNYEMATDLQPDNPWVYNNMGNTYNEHGNYPEAIIAYKKAIELQPDYALVYSNMGDAYSREGNYNQAIIVYRKAVDLQLDSASAYNNLGNAYYKQENYKMALKAFNKAIELEPDFAYAYNNLGSVLNNLGDHEGALIKYEKAVELEPDSAWVYNNIGKTHYKKEAYDKAIKNFTNAIDLQPDFAEVYNNLGGVYEKLENYEQAIQAYTKAVELQPENTKALQLLGWLHLLLNQVITAQAYFQKTWEISGETSVNDSMNLGHCALLSGDQHAAEAWYRQSISLWEDLTGFWQDMSADFTDIKMEERGISAEVYEEMVARLRGE